MIRIFNVFAIGLILVCCSNNMENDIYRAKKVYHVLVKDDLYLKFKDVSIMRRDEKSNLYNVHFSTEEIDVWVRYETKDPAPFFKSIYDNKNERDLLLLNTKLEVDSIKKKTIYLLKIFNELNLRSVSSSSIYKTAAFGINHNTILSYRTNDDNINSVQMDNNKLVALDKNWYIIYNKR